MVELTIQLPETLARSFGETAETQRRHVIEDVAVEEYRLGRLSHRQIGELLGLDYWETEGFLSSRRIALNYSIADLDADRRTLAIILNEK